MNILVIFTGGTIGSALSDGYIGTNPDKPYQLLHMFEEYADKQADAYPELSGITFKTQTPYTILSENMNGSHLLKLAHCIQENQKEYDGIIITHGTDTLQYTGAGLACLFPRIQIPVVLVSSNYILDDERANGFANFAAAVSFIGQRCGAGVFAAYQNNMESGLPKSDAPVHLHFGAGMLPHAAYTDCVYSLDNLYYGSIEPELTEQGLLFQHFKRHCDKLPEAMTNHCVFADGFTTDALSSNALTVGTTFSDMWTVASDKAEDSGILSITAMPGITYPIPASDTKAILLTTYHSGTLPTENADFIKFCKQAHKLAIPVYAIGANMAPEAEVTQYSSTSVYEELHISVLPKMSPVMAYMGLYLKMLGITVK